jgi:SAM-dependent methyltransferase
MSHEGTLQFYDTQSVNLIERYDSATMTSLHSILIKHIPKKSNVLDIGFGSGRDLEFLYEHGYNIWGIDPTERFVEHAKERFVALQDHFFQEALPFEHHDLFNRIFDAVICIAVWMHLPKEHYAQAVDDILGCLAANATVVISYSQGKRERDDGRYFEEVDTEMLSTLFKDRGFYLLEHTHNADSLNRDTLIWHTLVFKDD